MIALSTTLALRAQTISNATAALPAQDVLVFSNGDQLTGQLKQVADGKVYFTNDAAGKLIIPWSKIKELRSVQSFAVIGNKVKVRRRRDNSSVPVGALHMLDQKMTIHTPKGDETLPTTDVAYIVEGGEFTNAVQHTPNLLQGWAGSLTGGASVVKSTQDETTYNAAIALVRSDPAVTWLPPDTRTQLAFTTTYGKITQPKIPTVKTNIFHALGEEDKYFSARFYVLAHTLFDHNSTQGLDLQQTYGGGFGFSAIQQSSQTLDFTATIDYTKQQFQTPSADQNLIGSTFTNSYMCKLPRKMALTELASISPEWNNMNAYSANGSVGLALPVLKRFSFSVQVIDSYLNNPSPGFKANSLQFNSGITYTLP